MQSSSNHVGLRAMLSGRATRFKQLCVSFQPHGEKQRLVEIKTSYA